MKHGCPNPKCPFYQKKQHVKKDGTYFRKNDSRRIQRYVCLHCHKKYSASTFCLAKNQKKRRVNILLLRELCSGVSMRRAAIKLNIHRITVHRKTLYLAKLSRKIHQRFLQQLQERPVTQMQFDDLVTSEHTKLKPLSVSVAVDANTRKILGAKVSEIPAFGRLVERSLKKYGPRKSTHKQGMTKLFEQIKGGVDARAELRSDEHQMYPRLVKRFFPEARHKSYKGGRGCVVGQGELKRLTYDPLFMINHTCAMLRANINRLIRRTWCTSKSGFMLQQHLDIYINYHNQVLV